MKAILLLNGEPYRGKIDDRAARVYCCDGAYLWANGRVRIDENVGDFDSLPFVPEPLPREKFPSEKDETDGELALEKALSSGATEIEIYGAGGGREDHFLGNLHLLYRAHLRGAKAVMITNTARIFCGEGEIEIRDCRGKTLSIVPFGGEAHIIESEGLFYPLHDLHLVYGSTRGISNIAESDSAHIVARGTVLVLINQ